MKKLYFHTYRCTRCGQRSDVVAERCQHCGYPRPDLLPQKTTK